MAKAKVDFLCFTSAVGSGGCANLLNICQTHWFGNQPVVKSSNLYEDFRVILNMSGDLNPE